nr:hypothetical protein [Gemmatimonadaceae bacterium]
AASTAQAQRLRLTLVDSVGGAPIGGAIVTVLRADSTRHVEAIVGPSGMRVLPVHMPGTYRVRVRRVGYRPFLSGPITIAGVGDVPFVLRLPESRVPLPTVRTAARGRCDVGGPVDVAARETLEAVKTSLVSASVAWADQVDPIDVWLVSRRFSVSGRLLDSSRVVRPARTEEPFASDSAHLLHRDGYVRDELPTAVVCISCRRRTPC